MTAVFLHPSSKSFNIAMNGLALTFPKEKATLVVKKIALEVLSRLVLKTPVDTGRARGNWQVTVNSPATTWEDTKDKGGGATIGKGTSVIMAEDDLPHFWITNNVPYITRLEEGHSDQAPTGMAENTVNELKVIFG